MIEGWGIINICSEVKHGGCLSLPLYQGRPEGGWETVLSITFVVIKVVPMHTRLHPTTKARTIKALTE